MSCHYDGSHGLTGCLHPCAQRSSL